MVKCDLCNKGSLIGHNVSHSKRRTIKKSMPNLHKVTLLDGTTKLRYKLCTSCLKTEKKRIKTKELRIKEKQEVSSQ